MGSESPTWVASSDRQLVSAVLCSPFLLSSCHHSSKSKPGSAFEGVARAIGLFLLQRDGLPSLVPSSFKGKDRFPVKGLRCCQRVAWCAFVGLRSASALLWLCPRADVELHRVALYSARLGTAFDPMPCCPDLPLDSSGKERVWGCGEDSRGLSAESVARFLISCPGPGIEALHSARFSRMSGTHDEESP